MQLSLLTLDFVKVAEKAAVAAYKWQGKGDEKAADKAAVEAMRQAFNQLAIQGTIVIGEGERDQAPMLYIGEKLGQGGVECDIAVDPLEGTTILAHADNNALAVLAVSAPGGLLNAPDVYMEKIATMHRFLEPIISLDNSLKTNLNEMAKARKVATSDLTVTILSRERHAELIAKVRELGARVKLIRDGDIAAVIDPTTDLYMGSGGAPEGVLAAVALKTLGGQMCGKLLFSNDEERARASKMGIVDSNKCYYINDLVAKDALFIATGVTDGALVKGVKITRSGYKTESVVFCSSNKTIRKISSEQL